MNASHLASHLTLVVVVLGMADSSGAAAAPRKSLSAHEVEQYGSVRLRCRCGGLLTRAHCCRQDDPSLHILQRPHTVTVLALLLGAILYVALYLTDNVDAAVNVKWGIYAAVGVFVLIGMVQFNDGPFVRPHPVVWRAVLALGIAYLLFLIFLMFQKLDDARQLFKHINPALGVPLAEKTYAAHCELTQETIMVRAGASVPRMRLTASGRPQNQFDEFVLAHVLGWFGKSLILRDFWLSWILSIMFEVMEYSLQHQLPNFAECWWDHVRTLPRATPSITSAHSAAAHAHLL